MLKFIKLTDIDVSGRARTSMTEEGLEKLQASISDPEVGLLQPIKLNADLKLLCGERRLKAVTALNFLGIPFKFNNLPVPEGEIPAIVCETLLDQIEQLKAELDENVARENFTYLDETALTAKIARLQEAVAKQKAGIVVANPDSMPLAVLSKGSIADTAKEAFPEMTERAGQNKVREQLKIQNVLETAPDSGLAKQLTKAGSLHEATKILAKFEQEEKRAALAEAQGRNFTTKIHTVIHGDCLEELPKLQSGTFDVLCCDPIYGIDAQNFGNAAGKMSGQRHDYEDSFENFERILPVALKEVSRLLKPAAHLYLACDLWNLEHLIRWLKDTDQKDNPWRIPRYPIIQYKTEGGRVPHPGFSPRRSYEIWLYAYRGGKQEFNMIQDVIPCSSDRTETHGAGKPIGLLKTFLRRSAMPGDRVLDFMAGSGTILTACHELNLRCTAIEINKADYGRCIERLKEIDAQ